MNNQNLQIQADEIVKVAQLDEANYESYEEYLGQNKTEQNPNNFNNVFKYVVFCILLIPLMVAGMYIWKVDYNSNNLLNNIYTGWDASNYFAIAKNGYLDKYNEYPKSIFRMAFYPALPILISIGSFTKIWFLDLVFNLLANGFLAYTLSQFIAKVWNIGKSLELNNFIFWSFLLFPFLAFLHFNYTEVYFLACTFGIFNFLNANKIWKSQILGIIMGFFRPTALPFGVMAWLYFAINYYKEYKSNPTKISIFNTLSDFIFKSLGFLSYGVGSVCLFLYYQFAYGNWRLFFEAQTEYFGKKNDINFITNTVNDVLGKNSFWYDRSSWYVDKIRVSGFEFYTPQFNLVFLLWIPFTIAIVGSLVLIFKKKWYWLLYSWFLLIFAITSNTVSFNRYLLSSFPLLFGFAYLFQHSRYSRYFLIIIYFIMFVLTLVLFTHGFWIG